MLRRSGQVGPIEAVEDVGQVLGGYAPPSVAHFDGCRVTISEPTQSDDSSPRSVRQCVGEEVSDSTLKEREIDFCPRAFGLGLYEELNACFRGRRLIELADPSQL